MQDFLLFNAHPNLTIIRVVVRNIDAPKYDREDTRLARPLADRRPQDFEGVAFR
jgi:hypothetical protein